NLFRLHRRSDSGDTGADNREVYGFRVATAATGEVGLHEDPHHGPGARVGGEFEQRNPGQVSDDAHSRYGCCPVLSNIGKLLDGSRRPYRMEPVLVASDEVGHGYEPLAVSYGRDSICGFYLGCPLSPRERDRVRGGQKPSSC